MPLCSVNQGYSLSRSKSGHLIQFSTNNSEQVASHKNYIVAKVVRRICKFLGMADVSENFVN